MAKVMILAVTGMVVATDADTINAQLLTSKGIIFADVSYATGNVTIQADGSVTTEKVIEMIEGIGAGFSAREPR